LPGLDTKAHVNTLRGAQRIGQPERDGLYGLQWGDPDKKPALVHVRDYWLLPYVCADHVGLEIGPGGGRWTRYMVPFRLLYAVDYYPELLAEFRKNFNRPNIVEILNNGSDFPGVQPETVDFVFSFGAFVHLENDTIANYLENLRGVIRPTAQIVIQYSDKDKKAAQKNPGFGDNDPRRMRAMVESSGYDIHEEDVVTLPHSSIMRFSPTV
jgi:SAM-dependent methyltransferase